MTCRQIRTEHPDGRVDVSCEAHPEWRLAASVQSDVSWLAREWGEHLGVPFSDRCGHALCADSDACLLDDGKD